MKKELRNNDITFLYLTLKSLKYDVYKLQFNIYEYLTDEEKTNTLEILNKIEEATQLAERAMLNGFTK